MLNRCSERSGRAVLLGIAVAGLMLFSCRSPLLLVSVSRDKLVTPSATVEVLLGQRPQKTPFENIPDDKFLNFGYELGRDESKVDVTLILMVQGAVAMRCTFEWPRDKIEWVAGGPCPVVPMDAGGDRLPGSGGRVGSAGADGGTHSATGGSDGGASAGTGGRAAGSGGAVISSGDAGVVGAGGMGAGGNATGTGGGAGAGVSAGGRGGAGGMTASGGAASSGGKPGTGGAGTGGSASGGSVGSGGSVVATGGSPASGGATSSGGTPATGGVSGTGGATSSGGAVGTGGTPGHQCVGTGSCSCADYCATLRNICSATTPLESVFPENDCEATCESMRWSTSSSSGTANSTGCRVHALVEIGAVTDNCAHGSPAGGNYCGGAHRCRVYCDTFIANCKDQIPIELDPCVRNCMSRLPAAADFDDVLYRTGLRGGCFLYWAAQAGRPGLAATACPKAALDSSVCTQ